MTRFSSYQLLAIVEFEVTVENVCQVQKQLTPDEDNWKCQQLQIEQQSRWNFLQACCSVTCIVKPKRHQLHGNSKAPSELGQGTYF